MARYRKIDTQFWNDEKVRDLSHNAKLIFLFALTHPNLTMLGAMRISQAGMAEELGFELKAFREAFQEVLSKGMLKYDEKAFLLWAPNFLKYNKPESPNVVKSWGYQVDNLPECALKNAMLYGVKAYISTLSTAFQEALPEAFQEALPEALPKGMPNQEQEQEQEITISVKTSPDQENLFSETDEIQIDKPSNGCPPCPVKKIVELYNEMLPELPKATSCNNKRASHIRARWKECYESGDFTTQEEGIAAFKSFFEVVRKRPMLMRQKTMSNGEYINATIDFIFNPQKFVNICEGGMYL